MSTKLIHLSDIHYRDGKDENHDVVLRALFEDIRKQVDAAKNTTFYLVISGDVVKDCDESGSYEGFCSLCDEAFTKIGIPKGNRLCIPGNHDVSRAAIRASLVDHEAIVSSSLGETQFNDYLSSSFNQVFSKKLVPYRRFESSFTELKATDIRVGGGGFILDDDIGVFCINSAVLSSGGIEDLNGAHIDDRGKLSIDTRNLHAWLQGTTPWCRVLVMHHPLSHLTGWAERELRTLLKGTFNLFLSGHSHDQSDRWSASLNGSAVELSAPPLYTSKYGNMGYSVISLSRDCGGVSDVLYRQWTPLQRFVPGVTFTGTEDARIPLPSCSLARGAQVPGAPDFVDAYLSGELSEALAAFSGQPKVWIGPVISDRAEVDGNAKDAKQVTAATLVADPKSTIIRAPPQFGLTCLARYLAQQAWRGGLRARWAYLDARRLRATKINVEKVATAELDRTGHSLQDARCVILDSWDPSDKDAFKLLVTVCDVFAQIPVFVMETTGTGGRLAFADQGANRAFQVLYLWALSREHVRLVVTGYNSAHHVGDEDAVTTRLISDIDALNIHRTPLNCLTILKASEADFEESPVNRTEVLHRVLFILFNFDEMPTYSTPPDMKDCEYVLGYFAEVLLRDERYSFSKEFFVETLTKFCATQEIGVDIEALFGVLYNGHIIGSFGSDYCFKFTYWLYYFAAQGMHRDSKFAEYILGNMRYVRFPEIIEFYTGIDRRRVDALEVLTKDLLQGVEAVQGRYGLPEQLNPYLFVRWRPSGRELARMENEIRDGVATSNLPAAIKDRYADRDYDRTRPYHQDVREVLSGSSVMSVMLTACASARALRNSNYVDTERRHALLSAILEAWRQLTKVLCVLLPLLAEKGRASFDDAGFALSSGFSDKLDERFRQILVEIPYNVVSWYYNDLYSPSLAPLLTSHLDLDLHEIARHELVLLVIMKRPPQMKEIVQKYIFKLEKDSFYLCDVLSKLRMQYSYAFVPPKQLKDLEYLIKMSAAKHVQGMQLPRPQDIRRISDSVLPDRPASSDR